MTDLDHCYIQTPVAVLDNYSTTPKSVFQTLAERVRHGAIATRPPLCQFLVNFSHLYADFTVISMSGIENIILKCIHRCVSMVRCVSGENFDNIKMLLSHNLLLSHNHGRRFRPYCRPYGKKRNQNVRHPAFQIRIA